jgi:hypothetical protein
VAYGVLSIMIAIVVFAVPLSIASFGWVTGSEVGVGASALGIAMIWVTRSLWVPGLAKVFARGRR